MTPHSRTTLIALACGALALGLTACGRKGGPQQRPPMSVKTATAVQMDMPVVIEAFGNTKDRESVDVIPQVSGKLVKTCIRDGATVTNGQALFEIDPSDYAARVQQVEAAVAADTANLAMVRTTLERNQSLLEKNLISQQDHDVLKTKVDAAVAQLQADQAALEAARLNLSRCTIVSTVNGVCSKRYLDNGNLVAAGMTRLTNIRSYDPLIVEFSLSEEHLPRIRQALAQGTVPIEVTPRGDTNAYPGTLDFVDNAVNPMTGTILLRGLVPNPELKLWASQFVYVDVVADVAKDAVMVPEGAVQLGKQGPYLFVATKDGKADLRPVAIGIRHNDRVQIVSGVAAGEEVVVLGQLMLYPGAAIMDLSKLPPTPPAGAGEPAGH